MSFKENTYQQLSLTDSFSVLTSREQKALEKSWAKVYEQNIHSDSLFIREHLERMDVQEEKIVMVADGAYSGFDVLQGLNPGAVLL